MPYLARKHQLTNSLLYHVFNRGNARSEIFHNNDDYERFIKILINYSQENNLRIYHWSLMPNHYHLVLELDSPEKLSKIMAGLARTYVHYHHKTYKSAGHLWQERFKSQPVEKERYLLGCGRYIERNPLVAGIVKSAEDYKYSSAKFYCLGHNDGLTTEDPLFNSFGRNLPERQEKYRAFLRNFDSEEEVSFDRLERPMGSEEFLRRLVKEKGIFVARRRGKPRSKDTRIKSVTN